MTRLITKAPPEHRKPVIIVNLSMKNADRENERRQETERVNG
jgi:hypothetical protein